MRRLLSWISISLAASCFGCGSSSDDASNGGSTGSGGAAGSSGGSGGVAGTVGSGGAAGASGGSAGATSSNGCQNGTIAPGTSTITLPFAGQDRQWILHVPPSYDGTTPMPLVLNFHGHGSNMAQQELFSLMDPKADAAGFIVAYPNGLPNPSTGLQSWNAGDCCAFGDTGRDDLGFVNAMLDEIEKTGCIDAKRVYSTGMSNGGYMSHFLGCKLADRIAAIAPVAGVLGIPVDQCQPSRPMPMIEFHGTGDSVVPYDGLAGTGYGAVPAAFAAWAKIDGCTGSPVQSFSNGAAHCDRYDNCQGGVTITLCTIDNEDHCWPGQAFCPFGQSSTDIIADDAMWELFQKFSLL
jgi:polyhydroxybutyrate depolymerase